jgi:glycosyltransferase involved in cell wall biosynthesis
MAALQRLKNTHVGTRSWCFHYYGIHEDHVRTEAQRFGVVERVVLHGRVSREEALAAVKGASVAVVVTTVAEKGTSVDHGMVTGKLFEALGLGTPILLVSPAESDGAAILADAGVHASFTGTDIDGIAGHISRLLSDQTRPSQSAAPEPYAWPELIKPLDAILRSQLTGR